MSVVLVNSFMSFPSTVFEVTSSDGSFDTYAGNWYSTGETVGGHAMYTNGTRYAHQYSMFANYSDATTGGGTNQTFNGDANFDAGATTITVWYNGSTVGSSALA